MFPRLQPSAYYEELPYSYFRPIRSTRLLSLGKPVPSSGISIKKINWVEVQNTGPNLKEKVITSSFYGGSE